MKTNVSSELYALVIQKKHNYLLSADLDHSLYCWVIHRLHWLVAVFFKGEPLPCTSKDLQALCLLGGWLLTQGKYAFSQVPLTVAV